MSRPFYYVMGILVVALIIAVLLKLGVFNEGVFRNLNLIEILDVVFPIVVGGGIFLAYAGKRKAETQDKKKR